MELALTLVGGFLLSELRHWIARHHELVRLQEERRLQVYKPLAVGLEEMSLNLQRLGDLSVEFEAPTDGHLDFLLVANPEVVRKLAKVQSLYIKSMTEVLRSRIECQVLERAGSENAPRARFALLKLANERAYAVRSLVRHAVVTMRADLAADEGEHELRLLVDEMDKAERQQLDELMRINEGLLSPARTSP